MSSLIPTLLTFWALSTAAHPEPASATTVQRPPALRFEQGALQWRNVASSPAWMLTIGGSGIYLRQTFTGGAPPAVLPVAPDGVPLPDGAYKWELRPLSSQRPVEEADEVGLLAGEEGGHLESRNLWFVRRDTVRQPAYTGRFRVENGVVILTPADRSESDQTEQEDPQ